MPISNNITYFSKTRYLRLAWGQGVADLHINGFISILIEMKGMLVMETKETTELLLLFKALADKNRLKIIGLLIQRPHAVEEISKSLGLGASTISHHLSVLGKAGLISGRTQGYYNVYSLETNPLQETAKRFLKHEDLKKLAVESSTDLFDRKVLSTFTTPEGKIKMFPMQEKKFLVLVRYVLQEFQPGTRYTEKQVNEILSRFNKDTARLRRALVEHKFMEREGGGGKYWRIDIG
jgi:DNA-binding transcriptional ArsR family regulator